MRIPGQRREPAPSLQPVEQPGSGSSGPVDANDRGPPDQSRAETERRAKLMQDVEIERRRRDWRKWAVETLLASPTAIPGDMEIGAIFGMADALIAYVTTGAHPEPEETSDGDQAEDQQQPEPGERAVALDG